MSRSHRSPAQAGSQALAVLALCALTTGCASTPAPTEPIALAGAAITEAEHADAAQFAPAELTSARDKLTQAKAAADHSSTYVRAARLASEAQADAQLAQARARAEKAGVAAEAVNKTMDALRSEAQRPPTP